MDHKTKVELLELLNEMQLLLPPVEERRHLTNHYSKVETRIKEAKSKLMDEKITVFGRVNAN
jgi:hypothetical protein